MFTNEQLLKAWSTLVSLGYLDPVESGEELAKKAGSLEEDPRFRQALRGFRSFYAESLKLDPKVEGMDFKTMAALAKPRCGRPDPVGENGSSRVAAQKLLAKAEALGGSLRYFHVPSVDKSEDQMRFEAIERAFNDWSKHAKAVQVKLEFKHTKNRKGADIEIEWVSPANGAVLDLSGDDVIANATFPDDGTRPLLIHLDAGVIWVDSASGGFHIESVVLHEIGHLLGLSHDEDQTAVMFYAFETPKSDLKGPDKKAFCGRYPCKPPAP